MTRGFGRALVGLAMVAFAGASGARGEEGDKRVVDDPKFHRAWLAARGGRDLTDELKARFLTLVTLKTPNFAIFSVAGEVPKDYIDKLDYALEASFRVLTEDRGFNVPDFARDMRISVYVKPEFSGVYAGSRGHVYSVPEKKIPPFISIRTGLSDPQLYETTAHELFHVIQEGYGYRESPRLHWLKEGTAVWAEDEVWRYSDSKDIGYPDEALAWWQAWGVEGVPFTGVPGDDEFTPTNEAVWYGNAILFKYWTEHLPGGAAIIEEIFRPRVEEGMRIAPLTGAAAKARLAEVIAGASRRRPLASERGDFGRELLRAAVGSYLLVGPDPYNLERGALVGSFDRSLILRSPANGYYAGFDRERARVLPKSDSLLPLAALYARISAFDAWKRDEPTELFIAIKPESPESPRVALIEDSSRFRGAKEARGRSRVTLAGAVPARGYLSFVVPRFATRLTGGMTNWVDLVAVNADLDAPAGLTWSYAVSPPPHLASVRISVDRSTVVYDAAWEEPTRPDAVMRFDDYAALRRTLRVRVNELPAAFAEAELLKDVRVELAFSGSVEAPEAYLGDARLDPVSAEAGGARRRWTLAADAVVLSETDWARGRLELVIGARDEAGARLDAEPVTLAILNPHGWEFFESDTEGGNEGGNDLNHALSLARGPPYLASVRFEARGKLYYDAAWLEPEGAAERMLRRRLDRAVDPEETREGTLRLVFSRRVERVRAWTQFGELDLEASADGREFLAKVPIPAQGTADELLIEVSARGLTHVIDGDPRTIADRAGGGYEKRKDASHRIRLGEAKVGHGKFLVDSVFTKAMAEELIGDLFPEFRESDDEVGTGKLFAVVAEDDAGTEKRLAWFRTTQRLPAEGGGFSVKIIEWVNEREPGGPEVALPALDTESLFSVYSASKSGDLKWESAGYDYVWSGPRKFLQITVDFRAFTRSPWSPRELLLAVSGVPALEGDDRLTRISPEKVPQSEPGETALIEGAPEFAFDDAYTLDGESTFVFYGLHDWSTLILMVKTENRERRTTVVRRSDIAWRLIRLLGRNIESLEFDERRD